MYLIKKLLIIFGLIAFSLSLSSCARILSPDAKIYHEKDIVKQSDRTILTLYNTSYNRSSLSSTNKKIVKTSNQQDSPSIIVNDHLSLSLPSKHLNKEVFWIVDGQVFPLKIIDAEESFYSKISEDKSDILTADSSKVSVVTGYSETQYRYTNFTYELEADLVEKIKNAKELMFQYYAGADMITVKLRRKQIKKFKRFLVQK